MTFFRFCLLLVAMTGLVACGGTGPDASRIAGTPGAQAVDRSGTEEPFVLVDVGMNFAQTLARTVSETNWQMPNGGPTSFTIGVSDVLDISIVSNNDAGFIDFAQSTINPIATTPLPRQVVAEDGTVAVPLLGRVTARGRSVQALESLLTQQLSEVLVNPTAFVQLVERQSATVSVIGDGITSPGTYPINLSDRRLLDIVGRAGGPAGAAEDIIVSLSRGGTTWRAVLRDAYGTSRLNPYVRKGDLISLEPRRTQVQVMGATGSNALVTLEQVDVSLIDVLGEAGGLTTPRASLKGVFVYRQAPPRELQAIGTDLSKFVGRTQVPTIYRFDMTDPRAFFTAKAFRMRDDDILYVSDSANAKLANFFGITGFFTPNPAAYVQDATIGRIGN